MRKLMHFKPYAATLTLQASVTVATLFVASAHADYRINFQQPVTDIAREQYNLHLIVLWLCVFIGVAVFSVMFYSIFQHRKSSGRKPATFHESTLLEVVWTTIPFLIIVAMAFPATISVLNYKSSVSPDLTVKVVGHQWKWSYHYLDEDFSFYSTFSTPPEQIGPLLYGASGTSDLEKNPNYLLEVDKPMVVPANRKVRLLITSGDVIHSWWVPQIGVKQDAVPGIVHEAWFDADQEGTYRGQCAELCGKNHAFMPIVVEVVSDNKYALWTTGHKTEPDAEEKMPLAVTDITAPSGTSAGAQDTGPEPEKWDMATLMEHGEKSYLTHCAACHQASGKGLPPAFPALDGSAKVTGPATEHAKIVLHGVTGTAMASFANLSDGVIASILTYERNSWGNKTGDTVMPEDVAALR